MLVTCGVLIALTLLGRINTFAEQYAARFYPILVAIIARVSGLFPFSTFQVVIILVVLLLIFIIIRGVRRGWRTARIAASALCVPVCLLLSYEANCGVNYHRDTFAKAAGLQPSGQYTNDELLFVIDKLIYNIEIILPDINVSPETDTFVLDDSRLNVIAPAAMKKLAERFPCLDTYYPPAKPMFFSRFFLSRGLVCGIYSPFTIEPNYNADMPDGEKPFTVCHELSHLSGFMREDEANFIAYLACRDSGDADFLYSGYTRALTYAINAYYGAAGQDAYFEMYERMPGQVRTELSAVNDYWRPFRDTVAANVSRAANDAYLKANDQSDGVKSYGRFVDLLIAEEINK